MKLYITSNQSQAHNALGDFRGKPVSYVTSEILFEGVLRFDKRNEQWYVKRKRERIDIRLSDVQMIVDTDSKTKIITGL